MGDLIPFKRPIRWDNLRCDEAESIIRERVRNTDNVIVSRHALKRSRQRFGGIDFITGDLFAILETGSIPHLPVREDETSWKVIVISGCREPEMPVSSRSSRPMTTPCL